MLRPGIVPRLSRKDSSKGEMIEGGAKIVDVVADDRCEPHVGLLDSTNTPEHRIVLRLELADTGYRFGVPVEIGADLHVDQFEVFLSSHELGLASR